MAAEALDSLLEAAERVLETASAHLLPPTTTFQSSVTPPTLHRWLGYAQLECWIVIYRPFDCQLCLDIDQAPTTILPYQHDLQAVSPRINQCVSRKTEVSTSAFADWHNKTNGCNHNTKGQI